MTNQENGKLKDTSFKRTSNEVTEHIDANIFIADIRSKLSELSIQLPEKDIDVYSYLNAIEIEKEKWSSLMETIENVHNTDKELAQTLFTYIESHTTHINDAIRVISEEISERITKGNERDSDAIAALLGKKFEYCYMDLSSTEVENIVKSPLLKNIRELDLTGNTLGNKEAKIIALSEMAATLSSLNLSSNNIGTEGIQALANSEKIQNITHLTLGGNNIDNEGVKALAESQYLSNVEILEISSGRIDDNGAQLLAKSQTLGKLKTININANLITYDGIKQIKNAPQFSNTKILGKAFNP